MRKQQSCLKQEDEQNLRLASRADDDPPLFFGCCACACGAPARMCASNLCHLCIAAKYVNPLDSMNAAEFDTQIPMLIKTAEVAIGTSSQLHTRAATVAAHAVPSF